MFGSRFTCRSSYRILKNFPSESDLRAPLAGITRNVVVTEMTYYWCLSYEVGGGV